MTSVDWLTMVIAGIALFYVGADEWRDQQTTLGAKLIADVALFAGTIMFSVGATAATLSALGVTW